MRIFANIMSAIAIIVTLSFAVFFAREVWTRYQHDDSLWILALRNVLLLTGLAIGNGLLLVHNLKKGRNR